MVEFLTQLVVLLVKKSTGGRAETTPNGISGRISLPLSMISLIPTGLLIALSCLAIQDADPKERAALYLVLTISMTFVFLSVHFFTYRLYTNHHLLIADSLLMRERIIDLEQPFSWVEKDQRIIIVSQNRKKIRISWNVKGHEDFRELVMEAYGKVRHLPVG